MTHRLTTNYAKNYCNRTLIVKVIIENVVTCFLGTQCSSVPSVRMSVWFVRDKLVVKTAKPSDVPITLVS